MVNQLMLEKAHVSKVVKKLHLMKLINITEVSEDKRSSWLSVTEKGKETVIESQKVFKKWNDEWMAGIDEIQLSTMLDNLSALQTTFKNQTKGF